MAEGLPWLWEGLFRLRISHFGWSAVGQGKHSRAKQSSKQKWFRTGLRGEQSQTLFCSAVTVLWHRRPSPLFHCVYIRFVAPRSQLAQLATMAGFLCAALHVVLDFAPLLSPVFHGRIQAVTARLVILWPVSGRL